MCKEATPSKIGDDTAMFAHLFHLRIQEIGVLLCNLFVAYRITSRIYPTTNVNTIYIAKYSFMCMYLLNMGFLGRFHLLVKCVQAVYGHP
jgi:hypothetical protein